MKAFKEIVSTGATSAPKNKNRLRRAFWAASGGRLRRGARLRPCPALPSSASETRAVIRKPRNNTDFPTLSLGLDPPIDYRMGCGDPAVFCRIDGEAVGLGGGPAPSRRQRRPQKCPAGDFFWRFEVNFQNLWKTYRHRHQ